jgi:hypothetical protein
MSDPLEEKAETRNGKQKLETKREGRNGKPAVHPLAAGGWRGKTRV